MVHQRNTSLIDGTRARVTFMLIVDRCTLHVVRIQLDGIACNYDVRTFTGCAGLVKDTANLSA